MPSLREIRGHMRSVTGIAQVVHAMEAVSSVTTHRLQERVDDSVAYTETAWRILARLAAMDIPEIFSTAAFRGSLSETALRAAHQQQSRMPELSIRM